MTRRSTPAWQARVLSPVEFVGGALELALATLIRPVLIAIQWVGALIRRLWDAVFRRGVATRAGAEPRPAVPAAPAVKRRRTCSARRPNRR